MAIDVASYRRVAERWSTKEEDINPSSAAVLLLQMCGEIERLQKADYEFQKKLADGITDAFLERRWIAVSERLPEDRQRVLAYLSQFRAGDSTDVCQATFNADVGWFETQFGCYTASHWMPMPEPPEVK